MSPLSKSWGGTCPQYPPKGRPWPTTTLSWWPFMCGSRVSTEEAKSFFFIFCTFFMVTLYRYMCGSHVSTEGAKSFFIFFALFSFYFLHFFSFSMNPFTKLRELIKTICIGINTHTSSVSEWFSLCLQSQLGYIVPNLFIFQKL